MKIIILKTFLSLLILLPSMGFAQNGFIGIGTQNPQSPLHIRSSSGGQILTIHDAGATSTSNANPYIRFTGTNLGTNLGWLGYGGTVDPHFSISNQLNGHLRFWTNNTERMTIRNDGRIGIGTLNPFEQLHISGSGNQGLRVSSTDDGLKSVMRLLAVTSNGAKESQIQFGGVFRLVGGLGDGGALATRMVVSQNGNIGIGSALPQQKLDVSTGSAMENTIAALFRNDEQRRMFFVPKLSNSGYNYLSESDDMGIFWSDNNGFNSSSSFVIAPWANSSRGLRVSDLGGSSAVLEINSGGDNASPILAVSTPGAGDFITIFGGRSENQNPFIGWKNGPLRFATLAGFSGGNFSSKMIILPNGQVGIGTDVPNGLLTVYGQATKPGGGIWGGLSDERLKINIQPFTDGLSVIMQINPKRYNYNGLLNLPTDKEYIGVTAQEIQSTCSYMIDTFMTKLDSADVTETPVLSYDGSAMIYVSINAIKELNAKVEALIARVEELEQQ